MTNIRLDKIENKRYVLTLTNEKGELINHLFNLKVFEGTPEEIFKKVFGRNPKESEINFI